MSHTRPRRNRNRRITRYSAEAIVIGDRMATPIDRPSPGGPPSRVPYTLEPGESRYQRKSANLRARVLAATEEHAAEPHVTVDLTALRATSR